MSSNDSAGSANHVSVTINGRQYRMACEPGQEPQLLGLAENLEMRIQSLRGRFGEIGDARLTVMAALMMADELLDAHGRIAALQQEVEALRNDRAASLDRTVTTNRAVAAALNSAAERIERTTQVLNRTIGGGIAIG
ncbi:cell division protein ZapA [Rhodopseudomonas thermotolerans]|jgi:cell division protein ZapA|uniref:Cell division protein ZapA n=2 Tax=Rhodopseudomonas TaxID=1073 RepID=A0A336JTI2_9BRAD|nr:MULTISPECIES: cell division protein ZapA [Rhodopseudomonas]RED31964.1 cell division protein ZapA [Rhodopseudomonas pentothenatexigens]REF93345.1 cell division protein ZapA [Rhodopseudomonas thermotolerans]SSW91636.1 cell division protein ZapA [Rhodopseudomonas pentothenatexigens]